METVSEFKILADRELVRGEPSGAISTRFQQGFNKGQRPETLTHWRKQRTRNFYALAKLMKHIQDFASTGKRPQKSTGWIKLGDAAGTLTKKLLLAGYAHGAISVDTTQNLIDRLEVNEK